MRGPYGKLASVTMLLGECLPQGIWIYVLNPLAIRDTSSRPVNITNSVGLIMLRKGGLTTPGEPVDVFFALIPLKLTCHLVILGDKFSILLGRIEVTVPWVTPDSDYQLVRKYSVCETFTSHMGNPLTVALSCPFQYSAILETSLPNSQSTAPEQNDTFWDLWTLMCFIRLTKRYFDFSSVMPSRTPNANT